MRLPAPEAVLRHRGPALLVGTIDAFTGPTLRCTSRDAGPWPWARMLEGAAQTAGLIAGLQDDGLGNTAVIAEYRAVRIHAQHHAGLLHFVARLDRRLLHFRRCRVEVGTPEGALLLEGDVTLAPGLGPRGA